MQIFPLFKNTCQENHQRHETSPIVGVIVILKSIFFEFQTTITER